MKQSESQLYICAVCGQLYVYTAIINVCFNNCWNNSENRIISRKINIGSIEYFYAQMVLLCGQWQLKKFRKRTNGVKTFAFSRFLITFKTGTITEEVYALFFSVTIVRSMIRPSRYSASYSPFIYIFIYLWLESHGARNQKSLCCRGPAAIQQWVSYESVVGCQNRWFQVWSLELHY